MPKLVMFCGPNGSGKSSLTRALDVEKSMPLIDPDRLAQEQGFTPVAAGKEAVRLAKKYLAGGQSFARESTLSGKFDFQLARVAKGAGFSLELYLQWSGLTGNSHCSCQRAGGKRRS